LFSLYSTFFLAMSVDDIFPETYELNHFAATCTFMTILFVQSIVPELSLFEENKCDAPIHTCIHTTKNALSCVLIYIKIN
jgi:hypothetical protein